MQVPHTDSLLFVAVFEGQHSKRLGHFKVKCKAFRNKKSQKGEKPQGDTTHNIGEESHELIGVWDSDYTEPAEARGISTRGPGGSSST